MSLKSLIWSIVLLLLLSFAINTIPAEAKLKLILNGAVIIAAILILVTIFIGPIAGIRI